MKLKYKKIIMLTTMSTMGIGMLTLSISQDRPKAEESLNLGVRQEAGLLADKSTELDTQEGVAATEEPSPTPSPIPTPTLSPTPTSLPVYELEDEATYPKTKEFFQNYYVAKIACDVDKIKSMSIDPNKVPSEEELQELTGYIEDFSNIHSYVKRSIDEGSYIVYVYYEIKFNSINTPAPSLAKFYLVTDDKGNLKMFSGEVGDELKSYYDARNQDADVQDLMEMTNQKGIEAKDKDEDLANFWENLDNLASGNKDTPTAEGDTTE